MNTFKLEAIAKLGNKQHKDYIYTVLWTLVIILLVFTAHENSVHWVSPITKKSQASVKTGSCMCYNYSLLLCRIDEVALFFTNTIHETWRSIQTMALKSGKKPYENLNLEKAQMNTQ